MMAGLCRCSTAVGTISVGQQVNLFESPPAPVPARDLQVRLNVEVGGEIAALAHDAGRVVFAGQCSARRAQHLVEVDRRGRCTPPGRSTACTNQGELAAPGAGQGKTSARCSSDLMRAPTVGHSGGHGAAARGRSTPSELPSRVDHAGGQLEQNRAASQRVGAVVRLAG